MKPFIAVLIILFGIRLQAQETDSTQWTIEPAVSINPASFTLGMFDAGVSCLTDYHLNNRWVIANYTNSQNVFFYLRTNFLQNVNIDYDFNFNHLYGVGFQWVKSEKDQINGIYLLGGFQMNAYQEKIAYSNLNIDYTYNSGLNIAENYGLLYKTTKSVNAKWNFSMRYFLPIRVNTFFMDNVNQSSLDFGVSRTF